MHGGVKEFNLVPKQQTNKRTIGYNRGRTGTYIYIQNRDIGKKKDDTEKLKNERGQEFPHQQLPVKKKRKRVQLQTNKDRQRQ